MSCPFDACIWEVRTEESRTGALAAGDKATTPIRLEAGTEYRLSGACNEGCGDLDLPLRNPEEEQVAKDTLLDAYPVLLFTPDQRGSSPWPSI